MNEQIKIRTTKGQLWANKMTQKSIGENIVEQAKRQETKDKDKLAIEFGTTAQEWRKIDKRILSHSIAAKCRSFIFRFNNGIHIIIQIS